MICKVNELGDINLVYTNFHVVDAQGDRFLHHAKNGMMIISACQGGIPQGKRYEDFTEQQKKQYKICYQKTEELKEDIRREGLGFIPTLGGYPEEQPSGEVIDVYEFSLIVPRMPNIMDETEFVEFAIELCKKYHQNSVLISGISFIADGAAKYVAADANILGLIKGTNPAKVIKKEDFDIKETPYFTQLKKDPGTAFVFDSIPQNKCKNILDYYIGRHAPYGQGGHLQQAKSGELNPFTGKFLYKNYNK